MTSGEYENDIGTFFLSTANLLDEEAEYAIKVMKAIADPKTIKEMPSLKILEITQFTGMPNVTLVGCWAHAVANSRML